MASHRDRLRAPALIEVGAAFDINAGLMPRAPRNMRRASLAWLHRLTKKPARLWHRYLWDIRASWP